MSKPKLLLTNDDGIKASGLMQLWRALQDFGQISIIAPATEQSGSALSNTFVGPLRLEKFPWGNGVDAWKVYGTPVDCVNLGINALLEEPPPLVISGINKGSNVGRSVLFSGTVGASIASVMFGVPSIAFSYVDEDLVDEDLYFILQITKHILDHPPPSGTCINVNIPKSPIKGCRYSRQGSGFWVDDIEISPISEEEYVARFSNGRIMQVEEHSESDVNLLSQGYITITPIYVSELTDSTYLHSNKGSLRSFGDLARLS